MSLNLVTNVKTVNELTFKLKRSNGWDENKRGLMGSSGQGMAGFMFKAVIETGLCTNNFASST